MPPVEPAPFESDADAARRKALIMRLQSALKELGYYRGSADGVVGSATSQASVQFDVATGNTAPGLETGALSSLESFVGKAEREVANTREAARLENDAEEERQRRALLEGPWDDVFKSAEMPGNELLILQYVLERTDFDAVKRSADAGNMNAASIVGMAFSYGEGTQRDIDQALSYRRKSCAGKNAFGCAGLGWHFHTGNGVAQDFSKARSLYEEACASGSLGACSNLGAIYKTGAGVEKDYSEAFRLFDMACTAGNLVACNNLGDLYRDGKGVQRDLDKALSIYSSACNRKHVAACKKLDKIGD